MSDIGVYAKKETLDHKKNDGRGSEGMECFWEFVQVPNISPGEKMWFASEGRWQGYFIVKDVDDVVTFDSESWVDRRGEERKPFQGYTYNVPKVK